MGLAIGRINVIHARTLASEGRNAGNVLIVWSYECGRAIRYFREKLENASDIVYLANCMLPEHSCKCEDREVLSMGTTLGSALWQ
jgi:predicted metal-binding protein